MSIIQLLVGVILLVVGFWANNNYTVPNILRIIINIILVVIIVFLILSVFGLAHSLNARV